MMRERLLSALAQEFRARIPQFRLNSPDYQMILYAQRDLETWLRIKWGAENPYAVQRRLERYLRGDYKEQEDFRAFLNVWLGNWLEKWRERVKILPKMPKVPSKHAERLEKAKRLYREMDHALELKETVIRKLIERGEICMTGFIAENMIVNEIARRLRRQGDELKAPRLDPLDILNSLMPKIERLPKEKGPLLFLKVGIYSL